MHRLAFLLLAGALLATSAPNDSIDARLLSLARLWGDIKYFDPQMERGSVDWDAAALAAIPQVERATSATAFSETVAQMLATLRDPLTRVAAALPAPRPSAGDGLTLTSLSTAYSLKIDPALLAGADADRLQTNASDVAHSLASREDVVVDLRVAAPETSDQAAAVDSLFASSPVGASLVQGTIDLPAVRSRYYNGFADQAGVSREDIYNGGFTTDDPRAFAGTAKAPKKIAFLVDAGTIVPDLAVALLRAGKAVAFADGPAPNLDGGDTATLPLSDGVAARIRISEYALAPAPGSYAYPQPAGADAATAAAAWLDRNAPAPVRFEPAPMATPKPDTRYLTATFPDEPHRVLAVFRIYNTIRYFFPYRALMGGDWEAETLAAIRDVRAATDERSYLQAIRRYYTQIHDGHGFTNGPLPTQLYGASVPWTSRYLHGQVVVTGFLDPSACLRAGMRFGDVVTAVGGVSVATALSAQRPFVNGSTPQGVTNNLLMGPGQSIFSGALGTTVSVTFRHPGDSRTFAATFRRAYVRPSPRTGPVMRTLPGDVGYVDLDRLQPDEVDRMFSTLAGTRAIVFDDRGYPHGTAWQIAPRLTASNDVKAALFDLVMALGPYVTEGDVLFSHSFNTTFQMLPPAAGSRYLKPTIMLIDERTLSQAEHTGLFFEAAAHTEFVGTPTAGANGDVTFFTIPGGVTLAFSGLQVRHANGRQLQRVGLLPAVRSEPTAEDVAQGRDIVLETGLREALLRTGASAQVTTQAVHDFRALGRSEFAGQVRATRRAAALQDLELHDLGKSLPGAAGTHALPSLWTTGTSGAYVTSADGTDPSNPQVSLSSESAKEDAKGFTSQAIDVAPYRGKAVHFFGMLQMEGAASGGSFWARVDRGAQTLSVDDTIVRMPRGTHQWQPFSIVLSVPNDASALVVGLQLNGSGTVTASHLTIESVPADMPSTKTF